MCRAQGSSPASVMTLKAKKVWHSKILLRQKRKTSVWPRWMVSFWCIILVIWPSQQKRIEVRDVANWVFLYVCKCYSTLSISASIILPFSKLKCFVFIREESNRVNWISRCCFNFKTWFADCLLVGWGQVWPGFLHVHRAELNHWEYLRPIYLSPGSL